MKGICLWMMLATLPLAAQTGDAAVIDESAAKSVDWKSWAFAGGAVVAAAVGVTLVAINAGHTSHN